MASYSGYPAYEGLTPRKKPKSVLQSLGQQAFSPFQPPDVTSNNSMMALGGIPQDPNMAGPTAGMDQASMMRDQGSETKANQLQMLMRAMYGF